MYIYTYVVRSLHTYARRIWTIFAWSNNTCAPRHYYGSLFVQTLRFRVVLLLLVNIDTLTTSRRAPKPLQDKEDRLWHRREWERARCAAETAEHRQERLTKHKERDRVGRSTLTAAAWICTNLKFFLLCTYALQTCSILCVVVILPMQRQYTTQLTHTRPTIHCIRLVVSFIIHGLSVKQICTQPTLIRKTGSSSLQCNNM